MNPTVVRGYPVSRRFNDEKGLEIPISMAAAISHAQYATIFDGHFLLKGFCSALVPTLCIGSSIIWHYVFNANLERLSYNEVLDVCNVPNRLDLADLNSSRHFVGWTPKAQILIGE